MYTLKPICLFVLGISFLAYPCVLHGQDEIDAEIREEMTALHGEVRTPGLAAIRRNHNLSDDEFSARLVQLASITTNGEDATLRMFTIAALGDFGTTNALKFLEREALQGRDATGGITGYGKVSGFDDSFFYLAEKILADTSRNNRYRRVAVYDVYKSLLSLDKPYWRPISKQARVAAKDSLLRAAVNEDAYSAYVDDILMHGIDNYANNPQRLQIAQRIVQMHDVSDYTRNYFKMVLEQMEKDDLPNDLVVMSSVAPKTTEQQPQAMPSDYSSHKELAEKDATPSSPPTSAQQHCSMAFFIMLAFLVFDMALAIVVFLRRKK